MSKNKILSIAISLLVIPQITFAVWWNPISWFSFNKTKQTKEISMLWQEGRFMNVLPVSKYSWRRN